MRERAQTQREKEEFEEQQKKELKMPSKRKGIKKFVCEFSIISLYIISSQLISSIFRSVLQSVLSQTGLSAEELEQLKKELNEQK